MRLPTEIELISLIDYSVGADGVTPAINATVFSGTPLAFFWSSTSAESGQNRGVNFEDGHTDVVLDVSGIQDVRCVR